MVVERRMLSGAVDVLVWLAVSHSNDDSQLLSRPHAGDCCRRGLRHSDHRHHTLGPGPDAAGEAGLDCAVVTEIRSVVVGVRSIDVAIAKTKRRCLPDPWLPYLTV